MFKIGDTVARIGFVNGRAARVGQKATVIGIDAGFIYVTYPGHVPSRRPKCPDGEVWINDFVELVKAPTGPIVWVDYGTVSTDGYVDDFLYASISKLGQESFNLSTQLPYGKRTGVGIFRTVDAAKKYAEGEANDLKILNKFSPGLK